MPGIKQLGPTISAALPWLRRRPRCPRRPTSAACSGPRARGRQHRAHDRCDEVAHQPGRTLSPCFTHSIVPTGNQVINDGPASSGEQVYQELFDSAVGIAGASGNFDGTAATCARRPAAEKPDETPNARPRGPFYGDFVLQPSGRARRSRATAAARSSCRATRTRAEPEQRQAGAGP